MQGTQEHGDMARDTASVLGIGVKRRGWGWSWDGRGNGETIWPHPPRPQAAPLVLDSPPHRYPGLLKFRLCLLCFCLFTVDTGLAELGDISDRLRTGTTPSPSISKIFQICCPFSFQEVGQVSICISC